jgi:hypothetical protein
MAGKKDRPGIIRPERQDRLIFTLATAHILA